MAEAAFGQLWLMLDLPSYFFPYDKEPAHVRVLVTGRTDHLSEALVRTLRGPELDVAGLDIVASAFTTHRGLILDGSLVLARLQAGEPFGSRLARLIGSKGYHTGQFLDGPYPVQGESGG
jgi:hypothetical protein